MNNVNVPICHNASGELVTLIGFDIGDMNVGNSKIGKKAQPQNHSHLCTRHLYTSSTPVSFYMLNRRIIFRIGGTHIQFYGIEEREYSD